MARGGRSGGSRSFGGGSRSSFSGSVHRSSRSGGRGSNHVGSGGGFGGFGGYNSFGHRHHHHYYGGRRTTHVHYHTGSGYSTGGTTYRSGGGGSASGCLTVIIIFIVMIVLMSVLSGGFTTQNAQYIETEVLEKYTEDAYIEEFGNKDGYMIVICTDDEDGYEDVGCSKYRGDVADLLDMYDGAFWTAYDANYNDDLGIQLGAALTATAKEMVADDVKPLDGGSFDKTFYKDEIDWVDSDSALRKGAEAFYEASGIQVRIRLVEYKSFVDDYVETTNGLTKVFIGLVIAAGVVGVVFIMFKWWQARKKQKNIEDENTIKILNTPLESFGDKDLAETMNKYDTGDK